MYMGFHAKVFVSATCSHAIGRTECNQIRNSFGCQTLSHKNLLLLMRQFSGKCNEILLSLYLQKEEKY